MEAVALLLALHGLLSQFALFCSETGSLLHTPGSSGTHHADQAGLQLMEILPCLLSARIRGLHHYTRLSLHSYKTQDHQPRDDPTYSGLGPHTSNTNLKNALQACLQPCLMKHFEVPSSQMTLACVKMT